MNVPELVIYKILYNRIIYNDKIVPVIVKKQLEDVTPCITISTIQSKYQNDKKIYSDKYPLKKDHPLYEKDNPRKLYPQEVVEQTKKIILQINLWCNNEKQRYIIGKNIQQQLNYVLNHDYTYCINYDSETKKCKYLNETCKSINNTNSRGIKRLCINPNAYNYKNIFIANNIHNVNIDTEFSLDELDKNPPILRTIYRINLDYIEKFVRGGNPTNNIFIELELQQGIKK